ncbi:MAG: helix-turn-helix domain-containing protein [Lachnospiraceae bacterium]|nr:helix-turn-helix domain-containing protein [Lachnospiraceae bacterium]
MELKLSDNIKKYRKQMELTQEDLAEAFGVTVGAVSKWEKGANVPDVMTMMELANFFNISVDELLGYDLSSKNVEDMCNSIEKLYDSHAYEEAEQEAREAMIRYPHNFTVLYTCGNLYYYQSFKGSDAKASATRAIEIYEEALRLFSQNKDPDISEFQIKLKIADMYKRSDPEKSLKKLEEINYNGLLSREIAGTLMEMGRREESLEQYSIALITNFAEQYEVLNNTALSLASSGKASDIRKALEMTDTACLILDAYSVPGEVNYLSKLKAVLYILKAWWQSCLGDFAAMEVSVKEAYRLATLFDEAKLPDDIAGSIRYSFFRKKNLKTYDTLGITAREGIEAIFAEEPDAKTKKNYKHMAKVVECWNQLKSQ